MHGDAQEWSGLMMKPEMMDELPCNSFYRIACKQKHLKFIETVWLPGIHDEIRNFKGFRYRLVIPPTVVDQDEDSDEALEYVVILYFTGIQNLRCWAVSEERQHWVDLAAQQNITVGSLADSEVPTDGDGDGGDPDGGTAAAAATAAVWTKSKATKIELRHDTMKSAPKLLPPPRYKLFLVRFTVTALCTFTSSLPRVCLPGDLVVRLLDERRQPVLQRQAVHDLARRAVLRRAVRGVDPHDVRHHLRHVAPHPVADVGREVDQGVCFFM